MAQITITKRFGRKLTRDYHSWEFMTEMAKVIEVNSAEELLQENDKLFQQVKGLTEQDVDKVRAELKAQELAD